MGTPVKDLAEKRTPDGLSEAAAQPQAATIGRDGGTVREMTITFANPIRRRADVGVAPGSQSWLRLARLGRL